MNSSLWIATSNKTSCPTLQQSISTEVCIVGGGLCGVMTAYLLAKSGSQVTLIEGNELLKGATGNSTGKLTAQHDHIYAKIIKKFGIDDAKLYYKLNNDAVQSALELLDEEHIQKVDSVLFANSPTGSDALTQEWQAYQHIGIPGKIGSEAGLSFKAQTTLTMPNQAQIHPIRFGLHFVEQAKKEGAEFYEHTRAVRFDPSNNQIQLESGHTVTYQHIVFCTHYPIESIKGMQIMKLRVSRSYIIAAEISEALSQQYISVDRPSRSIRTAVIDGKTYLLLAGENHLAGHISETDIFYKAIEQEMANQFAQPKILYKWSAQDPETPDDLPYVGQIASSTPNMWLATGFRKWGMSNALVAAQILQAGITETPIDGMSLYSPSRTKFGDNFLQALKLGGMVCKEFIGGRITRKEAPKCTHLGCKTRWNEADETWDCPCHGSRFSKDGHVIEGPAVYPLQL